MKQRIIPDQLNELSSSQKIALRGWFLAKFPITRGGEIPWVNTKPPLPLMTIGQMIEFLDEHCGENCTAWSSDRQCRTRDIMPIGNFGGLEIVLDPNTVICDALWEACKEVLK